MATKIKVGDILKNSRVDLTVTNASAGKENGKEIITCRCGVCNKESTYYKKAFLDGIIASCKVCSSESSKKIDKLKLEPGDKINDVTILKLDTFGSGIRVEYQCTKCGKQHKIIKDSLEKLTKSEIKCTCDDFQKSKKQIGIIEHIKKEEEQPVRKKISLSSNNGVTQIPGFRYINSSIQGTKSVAFNYQCLHCCSVVSIPEGKIRLGTYDKTCRKCEELKHSNSIALTKMDWVGYISNCRRIQKVYTDESGIRMCEVQCIICGEVETLALAVFLSDKMLICKKCGNNAIKMRCPVCGEAHIKTSIRALYNPNNTKYICSNTGIEKHIDKEDLVLDHEFEVEKQYIKSRYNGKYNFSRRIKGKNGLANMIVFDSGYTGTDGQFYSNCMCIEHNKFMSLSDNELQTYMHEYCMETRMIPYESNRKLT